MKICKHGHSTGWQQSAASNPELSLSFDGLTHRDQRL
jgi:hypothetical protein